jgi:chemotaxis protein methyltransferase CheR
MSVQYFETFVRKIHQRTGIDLSLYKEQQMKRRLITLYEKDGYRNFNEYFQAISKDPLILEKLLERMTINVTEFYRNADRWSFLKNNIVPQLINGTSRLKTWSAACSSGEEPYSLAMLFKNMNIQNFSITATDIDEGMLKKANEAIYHEKSLKQLPKEYVNEHFVKNGLTYHLNNDIKRLVSFKKQNLLEDKFEHHHDLIVCRNVIIYFTDEAKDHLYHKFSQALRPGGILFVGSTEQIFNPEQYGFKSEANFFYKKISK